MALAQGEQFREAGIDASVVHWDEVPAAVTNGECPQPTPDAEPVLDGLVGILPIARGCMSDCSYCITKQATGRIDSPPVEDNVEKARALVHAGAREIRVTGQDTGVYGWDRNQGESLLPELLEGICEIEGDFRVRVGMANPKGIHGVRERLARVFASEEKLYNFLHVPVQSGSDDVLQDMRRQHEVEEFREVCETFEDHLEEWTLATDVIAGFPTETEADHEATLALLREVRPEKVNVTRFSKRPGTDAAEMKGHGGQTKKDRSSELAELRLDIVEAAYERLVGERREVLVVEEGREDSVKCRDDAYHGIVIPDAADRGIEPGDRLTVEVTSQERVYAFAEPAEGASHGDRRPPLASD
jgi:MiaB-like tRNA modifying enzyme